MDDTLQKAINAIKAGDKAAGQRFLVEVLRADPKSEAAWLWMAVTLDDPQKKRECLQRALQINPGNDIARKGLAQLAPSPPVAVSEPVEMPSLDHIASGQPVQPTKSEAKQPFEAQEPGALASLEPGATQTCPYCGESVRAEASVCRQCGRDLHPTNRLAIISLVLGILAAITAFAIPAFAFPNLLYVGSGGLSALVYFWALNAFVAFGCGIIALSQVQKSKIKYKGKELAYIGMGLGLGAYPISCLLGFLYSAANK
jgi:hypothetical protein